MFSLFVEKNVRKSVGCSGVYLLKKFKKHCFIVYTTASPAEPPSVTSGLRVSIQPTKRLHLSGSCVTSYQKCMGFRHIRCSHSLCSFSQSNISFQDPGYALGLCALFIVDTNPRGSCVSRSLEVGNTFLILSYYKAK